MVGIRRGTRRLGGLLLPIGLPALLDEIGVYVVGILLVQDVLEALHAHWGEGAAEQDVPEHMMDPRRHLPQIRRNVRPERMAARALLDEFDLPRPDLGGARLACGRLREGLVLADRRHRRVAAVELEGDDPVYVLVFQRGARRRDRSDAHAGSAIAHLNSDILHAANGISYRRGHDVASSLNCLQDFPGVGSVDPELAIAPTLEHEITGSAHHPAVVSAHARRRLVLPDHFLCDWVP